MASRKSAANSITRSAGLAGRGKHVRRRSKPKVVWIPSTNTNSIDTANQSTWQFFSLPITNPVSAGPSFVTEIPLVLDGPQSNPLDATSSLADIEGSGYRLRRIVGQIFVTMAQTNDDQTEQIYGVTAALMVRRMSSGGGGGSTGAALSQQEIDPDFINNSMDPWIWRRSWLLSNGPLPVTPGDPLTNGTFQGIFNAGPHDNFGRQGGSLREGPFVDAKTARIVGPEERLYLDVSAQPIVGNDDDTAVICITNLRVLGSMRTNIGNRRNASR